MKLSQVKETIMYIRDLEGAMELYEGILGLTRIAYIEEKHLFLRVGSNVLLLFNPDHSKTKESPPAHYADGIQHIAFEAPEEEYESWKQKLQDEGIDIIDVLTWKNGKESFYFRDHEDNVLEIVPPGVWE